MSKISWWVGLCSIYARMSFQSMISYYRWSFISFYTAHVLAYFGIYAVIWTTMRMFRQINGWGLYEVAFLYTFNLLSYSLAQVFLQGFWDMDELIVRGGLDQYLIRPVNPFVLLIARHLQFGYIAHISLGFAALVFIIKNLHLIWGFSTLFLFIISISGAILIQAGMTIIPSCAAFWFTRAGQLAGFFIWDIREFISYPISIYPKIARVIFTMVIPIAFINYYPSYCLLGRNGTVLPVKALPFLTLAIGLIMALLSYLVWCAGLKRYSGSGT